MAYVGGMDNFRRFAVYYAPPPGGFHDLTAAWLGWDAVLGQGVKPPDLGIDAAAITRDPRKYGFHGTIRAPFRLGEGVSPADLEALLADLAAKLPAVRLDGLELGVIEGFLALTPTGDLTALLALGEAVVRGTNDLRATLTEAEIAKRRPEILTPRQAALLAEFGYPGVMEEFRFHLTLTDRLAVEDQAKVTGILHDYLAPVLPRPFVIEDLVLFGEDQAGHFHILNRYALTG